MDDMKKDSIEFTIYLPMELRDTIEEMWDNDVDIEILGYTFLVSGFNIPIDTEPPSEYKYLSVTLIHNAYRVE